MRKLMVVIAMTLATTVACGGGGSSGSVEGFCAELRTDNALFNKLGNTASDSDQAIQLFESLAKKAPSEIKAEMQTLLAFLKQSVSDASAFSADPSASRSSSRESRVSEQSSSLSAASAKLTTFATDTCHINLNGTDSGSTFSSVASSISN